MKKFLKMMMAAFCAMTLCCLVGCGGNSPKAVVEDYFATMREGKMDEAYLQKHFTKAAWEKLNAYPDMTKMAIAMMNTNGKNIESVTVKGVEENGDKATVTVVVKEMGEETEDTMKLVKEDGTWKFDR